MLEFATPKSAVPVTCTMEQLKARYIRQSTRSDMAQLGKEIRRATGKLAKSPVMVNKRIKYRQWQADCASLFALTQEPDVAQVSRITPMVQETSQACHDRIAKRRVLVAKLRAMAKDRKARRGKAKASDKADNSGANCQPEQKKADGTHTTIV